MIGNDIVDLALARKQSNWQRKGWLDKIFTPSEQVFIENAADPEVVIWTFWTLKEAAYKAHQRLTKCKPWYRPKEIQCSPLRNEVQIEAYIFSTATHITSNYIFSEAFLKKEILYSEILKNCRSSYKSKFLAKICEKYSYDEKDVTIRKDQHYIPHLYYQNNILSLPFSFTHHGNFSAFSF